VLDPEPSSNKPSGVSPPPAAAASAELCQKDQIAFRGFSWPSDGRPAGLPIRPGWRRPAANALANLNRQHPRANDSVEGDVIAHAWAPIGLQHAFKKPGGNPPRPPLCLALPGLGEQRDRPSRSPTAKRGRDRGRSSFVFNRSPDPAGFPFVGSAAKVHPVATHQH